MSRPDVVSTRSTAAGLNSHGAKVADVRAAAHAPSTPTATPDEHLVSLTQSRSFEAEQYRTLCHVVESRRKKSGLQVIAVSSAGIGDGKTTTAVNLAGALAQSRGSRVLLIDGDLRRSEIAAQLRLDRSNGVGLADAIRRQVSLASALHRLQEWNLAVLTAGKVEDSPYELLKSTGLAEVTKEARANFDFVLLDCPPLLAVPDCRVIERVVDGFLLVVSANGTPRKLLEEALNILPPEKTIGIVFNRDPRPLSGYYGHYGHYYGNRNHSAKH